MKDYSVLDGMKRDQCEKFELAYDKGYKHGYLDGKDEACKDPVPTQDAYQRGLEDAWTASLTILDMDDRDIAEVFGIDYTYASILRDYTASEAIGNIKEWGERKKKSEITVGDEVIFNDNDDKGIVTYLYGRNDIFTLDIVRENGQVYSGIDPKLVKKTGRHFGEVNKIVKAMQEGKE